MRNKLLVLAAATTLSVNAGYAEAALPANWSKDCVGRLEIALPGDADQGAILGSERFKDPNQYGPIRPSFPGGENAGWTDFSEIDITHPFGKNQKTDALLKLKEIKSSVTKTYKTKDNITVEAFPIGKQEGIGWIVPSQRITLNIFANNALVTWSRTARNGAEFVGAKSRARNIVDGLRPRALFDIPSETGLCLPYVFIPDEGRERHSVAMSYRLKDHPDININLQSETAEAAPNPGGDIRPDAVTNDFRTDLFWGTVTAPGRLKSARSLWHLPAKRSMQVAGRPGMETFLAVVRNHAAEEDFIYLGVARGDPDHPEAAPDIRFFVEQKRENAIKRGIKPLTQDEVLTLARQIAASVKPRVSP